MSVVVRLCLSDFAIGRIFGEIIGHCLDKPREMDNIALNLHGNNVLAPRSLEVSYSCYRPRCRV